MNGAYANSTGSNNIAIGTMTLYNSVSSNNTAIGYSALSDQTTGSNNTALGYNTALGITTGANNTILGANVTGLAPALSNNIIIADGAGNQRINVAGNGSVGIGTTNPIAKLQVAGSILLD